MTDPALQDHLASWLGAWPPPGPGVHVVASPRRDEPTWDGAVRPLLGAVTDDARALVVVAPRIAADVAALLDGREVEALDDEGLATRVGALVAGDGARLRDGVLRWATSVVDEEELPDLGTWLSWDDPRVPTWLHPFGHRVLVALDDDAYVAGVGVKHHDDEGHELAVVTSEQARGRGLARRLVATAARRHLRDVPVVTYLHGRDNHASAHVADAVGLPDRGWRVLAVFGGATEA